MKKIRTLLNVTVIALVGIAAMTALPLATGCGTAEAKPLEVTYFYLPG